MSTITEYNCPNCNAGLEFNPETQKWKCNYCFSEFNEDEVDAMTKENTSHTEEHIGDLDSYTCTNCGAELIADDTTAATFCIYCRSHSIIKTRFSGKFAPKSVIPFKIGKEKAQEIYRDWIKKKKFAPKGFKEKKSIEKITGIYVPFWLFDNNVRGELSGEGTKVHTWSDGDYNYTQTKYYSIIRECTSKYNGIPVEKYLSSRLAETVSGYSTFKQNSNRVTITKTDHSYAMLPIYLLVNEYKGKKYEFIINGQTGKVIGEAPTDHGSQIKYASILFIITWLIIVFGGAAIV